MDVVEDEEGILSLTPGKLASLALRFIERIANETI